MIRYGAYAARQRMALDAPVAPPPPAPIHGPPGTLEGILVDVSHLTGVPPKDLLSEDRRFYVAKARHMAVYVASRALGMKPRELTVRFGREYSAIKHAIRLARKRVHASTDYAQTVGQLCVKHGGLGA